MRAGDQLQIDDRLRTRRRMIWMPQLGTKPDHRMIDRVFLNMLSVAPCFEQPLQEI
jgi:hypothetical protein